MKGLVKRYVSRKQKIHTKKCVLDTDDPVFLGQRETLST